MKSFPVFMTPNESIEIEIDGQKKRYELQKLPEGFIDWQISERVKLFNVLQKEKQPSFFNPHLPTLLTLNTFDTDFAINATCKGIGLVPIDEELNEISGKINTVLREVTGTDFYQSIQKRIEGAMLLYGLPHKINRYVLGGLEIFETKSYQNILKNPFVSLFYVGESPRYKSFQINCIAEIIEKDHPFYQFMINMRNLFEEARFHYQQPDYPHAVKYHIIEILDKSLKIRKK
jgi:hypothetical protein